MRLLVVVVVVAMQNQEWKYPSLQGVIKPNSMDYISRVLWGPVKAKLQDFGKWSPEPKWDAWNSLGDMSQSVAKSKYIEEFESLFRDYLDFKLKDFDKGENKMDGQSVLWKYAEFCEAKKETLGEREVSEDVTTDAKDSFPNEQDEDKLNESLNLSKESLESTEVPSAVVGRGAVPGAKINQSGAIFRSGESKFLKSLSLSYISNGYNSSEDIDGANSDIARLCNDGDDSEHSDSNRLTTDGDESEASSAEEGNTEVYSMPTKSVEDFLLENGGELRRESSCSMENRIDVGVMTSCCCSDDVVNVLDRSFDADDCEEELEDLRSDEDQRLLKTEALVENLQKELVCTIERVERLEVCICDLRGA